MTLAVAETSPRASLSPDPPDRGADERLETAVLILTLAGAAALWIRSLHRVDAAAIGHWGLLSVQPVAWYVAFALAVLSALAICLRAQGRRLWLLIPALVLLILIVHATPAIEYSLPRYDWTYKGIGVVDALARHRAPRLLDIYYDWPGFFSAVLWVHQSTGLSLDTIARWSPPFNELVATAGVWYLASGVLEERRTAALATLLYLVGNWIAQDYFSPQGFAYDLFLPVIGALIRLVRPQQPKPVERRRLLAVVLFGWVAILISHQLTPVELWLDGAGILLISAKRGANLRRARGWVPLVALGITEVLWVLLAFPYLHRAGYTLFTNFDLQGSASLGQIPSVHSLAFTLRSLCVDGLYFGFFVLGGLYGLRNVRRSWSARILLICVVMSVLTRLVQNYGGEGNLRTYLFALPFLACLLAQFLVSGLMPRLLRRGRAKASRAGTRVRVALTVGLLSVICGAFIVAYYGQEEVNVVSDADVAAMNWFYLHASPRTAPVYLADYVPSKASARYLDFPDIESDAALLDESPQFVSRFAANFEPALAAQFLSAQRPADLILTPSQQRYLDYFGILTPRAYDRFVGGLNLQPNLRLVYSAGGADIWSVGPASGASVPLQVGLTQMIENGGIARLSATMGG